MQKVQYIARLYNDPKEPAVQGVEETIVCRYSSTRDILSFLYARAVRVFFDIKAPLSWGSDASTVKVQILTNEKYDRKTWGGKT